MMYGISKEQQRKTWHKKASELRQRLERGDQMCRQNPDDKRLEEHWLRLLAEYQEACRQYWYSGGKVGTA